MSLVYCTVSRPAIPHLRHNTTHPSPTDDNSHKKNAAVSRQPFELLDGAGGSDDASEASGLRSCAQGPLPKGHMEVAKW